MFQKDISAEKDTQNKDFILAVTTCSRRAPNINKLLTKNQSITQTNVSISRKKLKTLLRAIYRTNKNIKDIFAKAKFTEATLKGNSVKFSRKKYNTRK